MLTCKNQTFLIDTLIWPTKEVWSFFFILSVQEVYKLLHVCLAVSGSEWCGEKEAGGRDSWLEDRTVSPTHQDQHHTD